MKASIYGSILVLFGALVMSACSPATTSLPVPGATSTATSTPAPGATATTTAVTPTATPFLTATPVPLPTATPIPAGGAALTPVSGSAGEGFALEFTNQVSGGLATLRAAAHTCSGIRGPWEGTFELDMTYGRMHISGSGPFNFTLPADRLSVRGEAPFTGGGAVSGSRCVILGVSDPLQFEITFSDDGRTANIIMGSVGGGTFTAQCPEQPPVTIPFAVAWGPDPLVAPVTAYVCP